MLIRQSIQRVVVLMLASGLITSGGALAQHNPDPSIQPAADGPAGPIEPRQTAELAPDQPAVTLTKTVGTNPAACAATDSVTLPIGGSQVTYCYTVQNTGNITLTRHTLTDNRLGTVLSNFPYSLAPGASAFLTQSATITQTTVNMATWTAFNPGPIDTVVATDTATVNVTVAQPAVTLTKTVGTSPAVCAVTDSVTLPIGGGQVTYCYEVRNTGNLTLTRHTLTDNRLGTVLNNFPYSLAPGASAFLTQSATITQTTVNTATWTAFNPGPIDTAVAIDTATVTVQLYRVFLPVTLR